MDSSSGRSLLFQVFETAYCVKYKLGMTVYNIQNGGTLSKILYTKF